MEQLSLRELQLLVEEQYTIERTRDDLGRMVSFFQELSEQKTLTDVAFCKERQLPVEIAEQQRIFFVPDDFTVEQLPEEFRSEALGMVKGNHVVYAGRLVYPVFDVKGAVMGFCGWDKFVSPKYLDSRNHGYKAKSTTFYGMEKLKEYYESEEPVYVTEGIVCALYLRSIGLNAAALLGSSLHSYVKVILRRFGRRLIVIPDNDTVGKHDNDICNPAGEHLVRQVEKQLPDARIVQSLIAKDIDDTRKVQGVEKKLKEELADVFKNPYQRFEILRVR